MPQEAGFSYAGSVDNLPTVSLTAPQKKSPTQLSLEKVLAKKDRIAALPPEIRDTVIDRLYDKLIGPKIPKSFNDQQKTLLKNRFTDNIMSRPPTPDSSKPTEADYKSSGFSTGIGGQFKAGVMRGLSNIDEILNKIKGEEFDPKLRELDVKQSTALKGVAGAQAEAASAYGERHPVKSGLAEFTGAGLPMVPLTAGMGEGIPAALKGAPLLTRILGNAAVGGVRGAAEGPAVFSPDVKGAAQGATYGAATPLLTGPLGAIFKRIFGGAAGAVTKAGTSAAGGAIPGIESGEAELEKIAQAKFGKGLKDLIPEQKIQVVNSWRDEATKAAATAKADAKKAAAVSSVDKIKAREDAKIATKIATINAMQESKALQKEIAKFAKANKRTPTAEELVELRERAKAGLSSAPSSAPAETPAPAAAGAKPTAPAVPAAVEDREAGLKARKGGSVIPVRGGSGEEKRLVQNASRLEWKDFYDHRFTEIRSEIRTAEATGNNDAATAAKLRLAQLKEIAQSNDSAKRAAEMKAQEFKAQSPEAVKAVSAVTDISKIAAPDVTVVPAGASGLSAEQQALGAKLDDAMSRFSEATSPKAKAAIQKTIDNLKSAITTNDPEALHRISDAERKALDRKAAAAMGSVEEGPAGAATAETVGDTRLTPEQELEKMEENFFDLTDKLEALGPKGKEAAKNLNTVWKKPPKGATRQMILEMGEKALTMMGAK